MAKSFNWKLRPRCGSGRSSATSRWPGRCQTALGAVWTATRSASGLCRRWPGGFRDVGGRAAEKIGPSPNFSPKHWRSRWGGKKPIALLEAHGPTQIPTTERDQGGLWSDFPMFLFLGFQPNSGGYAGAKLGSTSRGVPKERDRGGAFRAGA